MRMQLPTLSAHSSKQQLWAKRLAEFEKSGFSVAQFCHTTGCSVASFYQWKRKLNATTQELAERQSDSPSETGSRRGVPAFLRIETATPQAAVLEIKLTDDDISVLVPLAAIDSLHTIIVQLRTSCSR